MEQFAAQVDVRKFAPKDKQPMIFKTFDYRRKACQGDGEFDIISCSPKCEF